MIITESAFPEFARYIEQFPKLSVDTETTGLHPHTKDVVAGVSLYNGEKSFYIPIRHSMQGNINPDQYKQLLSILSKLRTFLGHNTKFDRHFLGRDGFTYESAVIDTQPGAQLLDENGSLKLKLLGDRYLGINSSAEEKALNAVLDSWGFNKGKMWMLPPEVAGPYAEKDAILAWDLADKIRELMPSEILSIWDELNSFSELLRRIEVRGILIDRKRLAQRKHEALSAAFQLEQGLRNKISRPINVNSPAQVARVFALPKANEETLLKIKHVDGVMDVLRYRWYMKAVNTYYNKYPDFIDGHDFIHTDFNITGTETGRISSSDPNLTAVPRWSEEQKVKDVFISRPGKTFIEADYSQAEIRVAAHYTKDRAVLDIFESGKDYHGETASKLGIDRQKAKVLNLALNYGAGINSLIEQLNWTVSQVKVVLANYHKAFPGFRKTSKDCANAAIANGFVKYWTGRRRHFDEKQNDYHKAFNSVVQGGTAAMVQRTMQILDENIPEAEQLLQVHDSILFEVDDAAVSKIIPHIKDVMEDQPQFSVPMKVDIKTGKRWSELHGV